MQKITKHGENKSNLLTLNVTYSRDVWGVYTNTDLTEGRGSEYCAYLTELETTGLRLGKGRNVQGGDAHVRPVKMYFIDGSWYAPAGIVFQANEQDVKQKKELEERRAKQLVIDRFKAGEEITADERKIILKMLANGAG